jgi:pimeloyl-ACP methyl ester carboxylesterase
MLIAARRVPGFAAALGWLAGKQRLRRNKFVLGDAFADAALLDGEFDEFFLPPLHQIPERRDAAIRLLRSFDKQYVADLAEVHRRIAVPVQLVWGDQDPFFPIEFVHEMLGTFPDGRLDIIEGAGLFAHEERPAEVARALLPVLTADR